MARLPYVNFHDMNMDWIIKQIKTAYTKDNPPPYPVKSVNGKTGVVQLTGGDIPFSEDFQQATVLDFCDYVLETIDNLNDDVASKQDAPILPGSPGDVLSLDPDQNPVWSAPAAGTDDYDDLQNKPQINGVTVSGNKTGTDFGLLNAALARMLYAPIITDTAAGDPANFPDGIADMPMEVLANIVPVQDLHGYANPWPGGGGDNILDPLVKFTAGTYYDVTLSTSDGYNFTISGTANASGNISVATIPTDDCVVYPAGTYTSVGAILQTHKTDGTWYVNRQIGTWTSAEPFIVRSAYIQLVEGQTYNSTKFIAMAKGSTAPTAWSPYSNICPITGHAGMTLYTSGSDTSNPDVYPVAWGDVAGTVYGGTFNSKTGKLTATHAIVDLGTLNFSKVSNYFVVIGSDLPQNFGFQSYDYNEKGNILCSVYKTIAWANWSTSDYCTALNDTYFGIKDTSKATLTALDFKTAMSGVQFVYELATPIEYDLYNFDLKSVYGDNNVWSDVGPVSVDYYADTKLFILKVI